MLLLVPTPIGNLSDITFRALEAFKEAEYFFCEDTRVTKRLLQLLAKRDVLSFNDEAYFVSFHEHNATERLAYFGEVLKERRCVYVSDAGMPGISDPGRELVAYCQEHSIAYDVLPGASAVTVAYAASGFESGRFCFYGFLPHKGTVRKAALQEVLAHTTDTVLYEAPHRLFKLLEEIAEIEPERELFLVKEISKAYQAYYRNRAEVLAETLRKDEIRGEWCVVVKGADKSHPQSLSLGEIEGMAIPPKVKAKLLAKITGESVGVWYDRLTGRK